MCVIVVLLIVLGTLFPQSDCGTVNDAEAATIVAIDWSHVIAVSNTTTTLQVVANPILNPATSPVAQQAGKSLAALNADLVRCVSCVV